MEHQEQREFLIKLAKTKMPYGKYKDKYLIDLPEHYIVWYHQKGFPKGTIGKQLQTIYEIKVNGLEHIIRNIQRM